MYYFTRQFNRKDHQQKFKNIGIKSINNSSKAVRYFTKNVIPTANPLHDFAKYHGKTVIKNMWVNLPEASKEEFMNRF